MVQVIVKKQNGINVELTSVPDGHPIPTGFELADEALVQAYHASTVPEEPHPTGLKVLGVIVEEDNGAFCANIPYILNGSRDTLAVTPEQYNEFYDSWNSAQAVYDYVAARLGIEPVTATEDLFRNT